MKRFAQAMRGLEQEPLPDDFSSELMARLEEEDRRKSAGRKSTGRKPQKKRHVIRTVALCACLLLRCIGVVTAAGWDAANLTIVIGAGIGVLLCAMLIPSEKKIA